MATIDESHAPAPPRSRLDRQYRVALPRDVRERAALEPGTELILIVEGRGRVTLATRDAVVAELHEAFAGGQGTAELLRQREEEAEAEADHPLTGGAG